MTVSPLDRIGQNGATVRTADRVGQATAVEQARAVAEVAAAVQVAQQNPRSIQRAVADMRDACGRLALAQKAFYRVQNRGEGPSVHLARALARIWGNIDYGVRELRRDDDARESEIIAFAWDQQTNSRSSRSFINPHQRMKKVNGQQTRQDLIDLTDIYLSNQNVGAKAVRECIFAVLPEWLVEEAEQACRRTLEHGEGVPLDQRVEKMIGTFRGIGVVLDQLEQKLGRKRGQWDAGDVASMAVLFGSIQRGEVDKDEEFPPQRVTSEEIQQGRGGRKPQPAPQVAPPDLDEPVDTETRELPQETTPSDEAPDLDPAPELPNPPTPPVEPASRVQVAKIQAMLNGRGIRDRDERLADLSERVGRNVVSTDDLTKAEASRVIKSLEQTQREGS